MGLYELVFIARQDIPSSEIDNIINDLTNIIRDNKGEVIKHEYWGIKPFEYEIHNNKKGHYVFLGSSIQDEGLKELDRRIRLREGIIRHLIVKTDKIQEGPSPILNRGLEENNHTVVEDTINVTLPK